MSRISVATDVAEMIVFFEPPISGTESANRVDRHLDALPGVSLDWSASQPSEVRSECETVPLLVEGVVDDEAGLRQKAVDRISIAIELGNFASHMD